MNRRVRQNVARNPRTKGSRKGGLAYPRLTPEKIFTHATQVRLAAISACKKLD